MTLQRIVDCQQQGCWLRDTRTLVDAVAGYVLTKEEADQALDNLAAAIEAGREGHSLNWAALGITRGGPLFLAEARRKGVFRISRFDYRHKTLAAVVRELVKALDRGELVTDDNANRYLRSVARLHTLAGEVYSLMEGVGRELTSAGPGGLKATLAMVDLVFLLAETRGYPNDRNLTSDHPYFYTPEDLAGGFSLLFMKAISKPGGWPVGNTKIDTSATVHENRSMELLTAAARVRFFREAEVLVDAFDYTLGSAPEGGFVLSPPSLEFLRAFRFGYMQVRLQTFANFHAVHNPDHLRLKTAVEKAAEVCGDAYVERKKNPDRYTFQVPAFPPLMELLEGDNLFEEEHILLSQAGRDLLTPTDELLAFEVAPGLTLHDVLRAQRYIGFLRWYAARYLLPVLSKRPGVVLQSLLPSFTEERAKGYFATAIGAEKAEKLLDLLTFHPDRDKVFDVQYQPVVRTGAGYVLGLNLFAGSNLLRNVLQKTTKRLYPDGRKDPLVALTRNSLAPRADYVHPTDLKFTFGGSKSDVDVLAVWQDVFFALECKNSLLPAGPFELRTSFDYVVKGMRQLDFFRTAFADGGFRKWLAGRIGRPVPDNARLVTGVVVSNRMLLGYRAGANCVRSVYELVHFLEEGTIHHAGEAKRFWAGDVPTADDLSRFFDEDLTYRPAWESMREYTEQYSIGRYRIAVPSLILDMERLAERLGLEEARKRVAVRAAAEKEEWAKFYADYKQFAIKKLAERNT